jgi:hypothetical protein
VTDDDGEDVLAEFEEELSGFAGRCSASSSASVTTTNIIRGLFDSECIDMAAAKIAVTGELFGCSRRTICAAASRRSQAWLSGLGCSGIGLRV